VVAGSLEEAARSRWRIVVVGRAGRTWRFAGSVVVGGRRDLGRRGVGPWVGGLGRGSWGIGSWGLYVVLVLGFSYWWCGS
jgi:hypothetical protein